MNAHEERVLELCDLDYASAEKVAAEIDRLRAELSASREREQRLTETGNGMADAIQRGLSGGDWFEAEEDADSWRKAVRGDAPTDEREPGDCAVCPPGKPVTAVCIVDHPRAPAVAPTDGQGPADELRASDYEAALAWFRDGWPDRATALIEQADRSVSSLCAATIVRHVLAAEDVDSIGSHELSAAPADGPEYAIIETNRGGGVEYPVAERNTNGPAGWMIGGEFVPDVAVTHVEPVTVLRASAAPADDTAAPDDLPEPDWEYDGVLTWDCPVRVDLDDTGTTSPARIELADVSLTVEEATRVRDALAAAVDAARPARDGGEPK
ncbi:hypothetical protein [Pseudonocardia sp. NPDC049635]|uniref:hypothetical protein n=1 Tax=Pseudonocardia sp. NPDC049635 TaxID=3155506 RepID=UPI00340C25BA